MKKIDEIKNVLLQSLENICDREIETVFLSKTIIFQHTYFHFVMAEIEKIKKNKTYFPNQNEKHSESKES